MSWWADRSIFAKIFTVLGFAFLAGVGLCGVDAAFLTNLRTQGEEFGPNTLVGGIGAFAIVLSTAGLLLTPVVWLVARVFRRGDSESEQLFDDKDEDR
jgi:hypothetical protein